MRRKESLFALLIGLLLQMSPVSAQQKTIPQRLAEYGADLTRGASVPSGVAPDVDVILRDTDLIVRGVVGDPRTYLSTDQMTIFSDYPIVKPLILFDTVIASSSTPGVPEVPEIVVTVEGGKITLGGLTFTVSRGALPGLPTGSECFLLLKRVGGKLHVAGDGYLGAFEIDSNKLLKPLTRVHDFAPAYHGAEVTAAVNSIVARRYAVAP